MTNQIFDRDDTDNARTLSPGEQSQYAQFVADAELGRIVRELGPDADGVRALLRLAWAVRVLDACGVAWKNTVPAPIPVYNEPRWVVVLPMHIGAKYGYTPEAARHAAALAVWPTLSAEEQARIGECP